MSNIVGDTLVTENSIKWIEESISKGFYKYYDYKFFHHTREIGSGGFGKVYRAKWKNTKQYVALKTFFNFNNKTAGEIVKELILQREVDFHENVIRFLGFTSKNLHHNPKEYILVMEYADGGTLKHYLSEKFPELTWDNKYNLAYQLASAVSCLHSEKIVHRDLHSGNVLIHKEKIKLADFGLSKRIENGSKSNFELFGVIPYVDPNSFIRSKTAQPYTLNEKSDIYSIGVLLWEISSGHPPFPGEKHDVSLALEITQGRRETPVPDTPDDYVMLYTKCWDFEPDNRPTIDQIVSKLEPMFIDVSDDDSVPSSPLSPSVMTSGSDENIDNISLLSPGLNDSSVPVSPLSPNFMSTFPDDNQSEMSSFIQSVDIDDLESIYLDSRQRRQIVPDYGKLIDEIINLPNKVGDENIKKDLLNYLHNNNITEQQMFDWLLKNQNDSNAKVLLGNFYSLGINTTIDKKKAFELYQEATNLGNETGMSQLGYCYGNGIGTEIDKKKAFKLFQKSSNFNNAFGMNMLGYCYQHGIETNIDKERAFQLFNMASELGNANGINNLACCYDHGIGIKTDKEKAFKLYKKAADLDESNAQYNLALIYEEIKKDLKQAKFWYFKSAEQGDQDAKNKLDEFLLKEEEKNNEYFVV